MVTKGRARDGNGVCTPIPRRPQHRASFFEGMVTNGMVAKSTVTKGMVTKGMVTKGMATKAW